MSIFTEDELQFDFSVADNAIKFDDQQNHFMSHCMSAVDFIIEWNQTTFLVEIKDINRHSISRKRQNKFIQKVSNNSLKRELVKKYSDSMLYKWAEQTISLQNRITYLVLLEAPQINPALRLAFIKNMKEALPLAKPDTWQNSLIDGFQLHDLGSWNRNFPQFPITRISQAPAIP